MTLPELESAVRDLTNHVSEIVKKIRSTSNVTEATVNSIDDRNYAYCEIKLMDTNLVCKNVPIKIHEDLLSNGHMPGIGSVVVVEHQHDGMGAKVISLATATTDFISDAADGKGSSAIKGFIPKA